jgi:Outer membrane protein beta-barrel domain
MPKQSLILVGLLATLFAIPVRADETKANPAESQVNLHIGGGVGVPLGPTSKFAGVGGTFQAGAGPNLGKHHSIVGEFMWHALPPNQSALLPVLNAFCQLNPPVPPSTVCSVGSIHATDNVYALTANYMYHREGKRFGYYAIGGGGWYYRKAELQNFTVPPGTACVPVWTWWGYTCQGGFVTNSVLASKGISSGGVNGGVGITVAMTSGLKFYVEARYHYSPQGGRVSTQLLPVTMGIRW